MWVKTLYPQWTSRLMVIPYTTWLVGFEPYPPFLCRVFSSTCQQPQAQRLAACLRALFTLVVVHCWGFCDRRVAANVQPTIVTIDTIDNHSNHSMIRWVCRKEWVADSPDHGNPQFVASFMAKIGGTTMDHRLFGCGSWIFRQPPLGKVFQFRFPKGADSAWA